MNCQRLVTGSRNHKPCGWSRQGEGRKRKLTDEHGRTQTNTDRVLESAVRGCPCSSVFVRVQPPLRPARPLDQVRGDLLDARVRSVRLGVAEAGEKVAGRGGEALR